MTNRETLFETLDRFAQACTDNARLRQMNHDWFRTIEIAAEDLEGSFWLRYEGGPVTLLTNPPGPTDLMVEAPSNILVDIFSGASTPTEPYLSGDLRVRGSQDDIMRLDIISLLIWGE